MYSKYLIPTTRVVDEYSLLTDSHQPIDRVVGTKYLYEYSVFAIRYYIATFLRIVGKSDTSQRKLYYRNIYMYSLDHSNDATNICDWLCIVIIIS